MSAAAGVFNVVLILVVVVRSTCGSRGGRRRQHELTATVLAARRRAYRPHGPARRNVGWQRHRRLGAARSPACSWRWSFLCALHRDAAELAAPEQRRRADPADAPAPRVWQLSTYTQVLGDDRFLNWLKTSLLVATTSTLIVDPRRDPGGVLHGAVPLPRTDGLPASSCWSPRCSRRPRWSSASTASSSTSTWSTPTCALILTNAAFNLAFAVWILHGFFSSIPKEVEEAAHLDGCGRVRHAAAGHAAADAARRRHRDRSSRSSPRGTSTSSR